MNFLIRSARDWGYCGAHTTLFKDHSDDFLCALALYRIHLTQKQEKQFQATGYSI